MPNVNLNQDGEFDAELAVPDVDAVSTAQKSKKQGSQPGLLFFLVWIVEIVVICFVGLVVLASWWLVTTVIRNYYWFHMVSPSLDSWLAPYGREHCIARCAGISLGICHMDYRTHWILNYQRSASQVFGGY
jgi:hypothetical protein